MRVEDEWGADPSVRFTRAVFAAMEQAQKAFLAQLPFSAWDLRIRRWREKGLVLFEKMVAASNRRNVRLDPESAGAVYVHVLAHVIAAEGNDIPQDILPAQNEIQDLFKEIAL